MSWAEVKKINSNLDVSLNELITSDLKDVKYYNYKGFNASISIDDFINLCEINSPGVVRLIKLPAIQTQQGSMGEIVLSIDDNVFDFKIKTTSSPSQTMNIYFICTKDICLDPSSLSHFLAFFPSATNTNKLSFIGAEFNLSTSPSMVLNGYDLDNVIDIQTVSGITDNVTLNAYYFIDNPIYFNNLSIRFKRPGWWTTSTSCSLHYTLL